MNIIEANLPKVLVDRPVKALNEEYRNVMAKYRPADAEKVAKVKEAITEQEIADGEHTYREYQAHYNFLLMNTSESQILDNYMELVCQYGYICLFSAIFPLAAVFSLISNSFQIHGQIANLGKSRRFKAEVANGIGEWLYFIDLLAQFSIIMNCAIIYFTSKIYRQMFVVEDG